MNNKIKLDKKRVMHLYIIDDVCLYYNDTNNKVLKVLEYVFVNIVRISNVMFFIFILISICSGVIFLFSLIIILIMHFIF